MRSSPRFRPAALLAAAVTLAATSTACSDKSSTGPDPVTSATQAADRFDDVADSLYNVGEVEGSDVAQAMADLIRSAGRVDRVVVKVDGRSVTHTTLALETLVTETACDNASDPVGCRDYNPPFNQVVIGWTATNLKEGFIMSSDQPGVASVVYDGGDVYPPGDLLYFQRDATADGTDLFGAPSRMWIAESGTVTTQLGTRGAVCDLPAGSEPGLAFTCNQASFTPSFDVFASRFDADVATSVHLTMAAQRVDGLSVTVTEADDPTVFSLARPRTTAERKLRAAKVRGLLRRVAPVLGDRATPR